MSADLMGIAGPDGYFKALNPAWQRILGFSDESMKAQPFIEFVHPADRERTLAEAEKIAATGYATADFQNRYAVKDGGWRWLSWRTEVDEAGDSIFVARDVTDQVMADQRRHMLASLVERADDAILSKTIDGVVTTWNQGAEELYGYTEAEAVGRPVEDLIIPAGRENEPKLIVERLLSGEGVRQYFTERCRKDGSAIDVSLTASLIRDQAEAVIGVAVISRYASGFPHTHARVRELDTLSWVGRIRDAIDQDRLVFFAQPIVKLSGAPHGHELLCRILDPSGRVVAPSEFLPAAESYGLMDEIDLLAIKEGSRLAGSGHRISVNVSAASVIRASTARFAAEELKRAGADPAYLTFELTETALMRDMNAARRFTESISSLGCQIALDDFGTGFGGFTYLKRLHIDQLKIDTEFVRDLPRSEASQHVAQAVISLANRFGLQTVAEGVEDSETLALLSEYGADMVQGYFLGRPAPFKSP